MDKFAADVVVNLVSDALSRVFRSLGKKDMTTEYKESLDYNVCLARAILVYLSKVQTIKNEYLKKWYSDLIVAADEGERVLQSSTTNTMALKRATSRLENLTSKANTYFILFESEKKAADAALRDTFFIKTFSAADCSGILKTSRSPADNYSSLHWMTDFLEIEKKKAISSRAAAGYPETFPFIAPRPASYNFVLPTMRELKAREEEQDKESKKRFRMIFARSDYQPKQLSPVSKNSIMITGRISKTHGRIVKNMKVVTCMGLHPEGAGFPSDTNKDSICKEPQKNLYDSTNMRLIDNGEHSINDCKKMKGKCPECEFDEQTGYGEASMSTWSYFPSILCRGAGNHISPSFDDIPEEHDGYLSQAGTFDEHTGYGNASMPNISCFPSSSFGGASNVHISSSFHGITDENNGHVGDDLKSFDGIPEEKDGVSASKKLYCKLGTI